MQVYILCVIDLMECITEVENYVYLGVNIDKKLNFEKFINGTILRVNGRLITLARIRKLINDETALIIYKQTILPILDYVSILVNSSTQKKIDKLQPLQNRAVRIIAKLGRRVSTDDMKKHHKSLKLRMLSERRKMFMLTLMYKFSQNIENVNRYRPDISLRTGPKVKMKVPFTDKDRVLRSPYYKCNSLWDKLDSGTQLSNNNYI